MQVKSKSGRVFDIPTPEEEKVIRAGIATDLDVQELSDAEMKKLRHYSAFRVFTFKNIATPYKTPAVFKYPHNQNIKIFNY